MEKSPRPDSLSPSATRRLLQSLAQTPDARPTGLYGEDQMIVDRQLGLASIRTASRPHRIRPLAAAASHYLDDADRDLDVIDLRDTGLPVVSEEVVLGRIPPIGAR